MNSPDATRPADPGPRPDVDPPLAPEPGGTHDQAAAEQYAHGLLSFLLRDDRAAQERRVRRVMDALRAADQPTVVGRIGPATVRAGRAMWVRFASAAAAVALIAAIVIPLSAPPSATAMVRSAIDASKRAGDRRYEIRAMMGGQSRPGDEPIGVVDVRSGDRYVIRSRTPFGDTVWLGRDAQGVWAVRPDGSVDRFPPRHVRPRWLDAGESTMFLDSVEGVLDELAGDYALNKADAGASPAGGPECDRITAVRTAARGPQPNRIELWIERDTRLVRRMELHWTDPMPMGQGPGGPGGLGGKGPGRPPRAGERGPEGMPPPPMGEGPKGFPPPGPGGPGGPGGPAGPGKGKMPPPDGGERRGDGQRDGPRGDRPPPRFLDRPPEFGGGRQPPPPRLLVFERVPAEAMAETWFSPEAHVPSGAGREGAGD
ncbi:MAG: hypothetical protein KIT68_03060 [Phycisphaeraceae bacterium]|nr:hypothetical protein [Phycisphaeraceae bacterium]